MKGGPIEPSADSSATRALRRTAARPPVRATKLPFRTWVVNTDAGKQRTVGGVTYAGGGVSFPCVGQSARLRTREAVYLGRDTFLATR
jgi:hypothetical protein